MNIISKNQISSFKKFIDSHETFIIAGHKEPDGDCVSSCLGISFILEHFNKPYIIFNLGPFKRNEIKKFGDKFVNEIPFMSQTEIEECGLIIADCSELSRIGDTETDLKSFDTFIIDHHKTANVEGENNIIDSTSPAAACLVQQLFESLVGKPDEYQAYIFFFGLATDTGYFRYLTTDSSEVFKASARLVDYGANPKKIYQEITSGKAWDTRKLLGILLNRAERYCNGKLVATYETMEDTKKYGQEGRDSDALYSLMLEVENVEAVVFLRQESEFNCTMGLRSKDDCDVSQIAAKFGGGGHKNASGASTEGRIETILPVVIKEFSKVL